MAVYLAIPILDELVRFAEIDSTYEDSVKAMASGIFSYYFPVANGYTIAPEQNRGNNYADFVILRTQRRFPGDRSVVEHTVAEAKRQLDAVSASLDQLHNAIEHSNTEFGRCWAILIHGPTFHFYEYHKTLPTNARLVPWGPPNQHHLQNTFHARRDSVTIDWMLRHMALHDTPPAR